MKSKQVIHPLLAGLMTVAFLTAFLSACQSMGTAAIPPDQRIALQPAGPHQGQADTGDLVIGYTYELGAAPDRQIHMAGGVQSARQRWDIAKINLLFLDDTGRTLGREVLFASGYRNLGNFKRPPVFDATLPLPLGTTAIAFSSFVQADPGHR